MSTGLISVAPMLDWTDRHYRYFLRLLSPHVWLYTEMVTTGALLHGDPARALDFSPQENPLVLQLGGSEPKALADCAKLAQLWGYNAVNLNVGCPSNRVQQGKFGACLMAEPLLVAECISAMQEAVDIPITVKTRLGIDEKDSYPELQHFIATVATAGCKTFILHARKAWLKGLSPKENREIPPLRYDMAAQIVRDFPQLALILNGGIQSLTEINTHLTTFAGVMLGRIILQQPSLLLEIERALYKHKEIPSLPYVGQQYFLYAEQQYQQGVPWSILLRPLMALWHGLPGAKQWRRLLTHDGHGIAITAIKDFLEHAATKIDQRAN